MGKYRPEITPYLDTFYAGFAKETCQHDPKLYMASQDVISLFKNILLDETINICIDKYWQNPSKIPKHYFRNLFNIVTKESVLTFNWNIINKETMQVWDLDWVQTKLTFFV